MKIHLDVKPFKDHVKKLEKLQSTVDEFGKAEMNRVTDRHLARIKKNTSVGDSPYSPTLRNTWDRSGIYIFRDGFISEVFNPTKYAPYYEYGHRQTPGRLIFVELKAGQGKYGQMAKQVKKGPHAGKWGIYIRLKKSFVKGRFVMTDSEAKAQRELDAAVKRIEKQIQKGLE